MLIVVNPKAGRSNPTRSLHYIEKQLRLAGIESRCFFTVKQGMGLLSKEIAQGDFSEIMVLGGDGTLNYVVNEMQAVGQLPLSIVSLGTGNDSVRSLHGVRSLKEQVSIAIHGALRSYDLGRCNGRYFVNGLGIGFDGQVVLDMEGQGKKRKSRMDYLRTVLRILYSFKEKEVEFSLDGRPFKRKVLLLTVSNGTTFGGGFVINPFARADDGLLDLCILGEIPPLKRFWHLPKLSSGGHSKLQAAEFERAERVNIAPSRELVAHLDGEYFGHPPFEIEVVKDALLLRSPDDAGDLEK